MAGSRSGRRVGKLLASAAVLLGCLVAVTAGGPAQAADCAGTPSDINGDGFPDLVVGSNSFRDGGPLTSRGAIEVTYGSATGFSDDSPSQAFTGQLPGGFNVNWMANGLAVGYFDDDCFADIITDERLINDYADLLVLSGSAGGVDLSSPRTILQTDLTPSNPGSLLGEALVVGDFNDDGFDDVAAGAPGWPYLGPAHGGVAILYGSATGLVASKANWFTQDTPGVPGANEPGDQFGAALAAELHRRRLRRPGHCGTHEDIGGVEFAGAVTILKGSPAGITASESQSWHQGSPGVPGSNELGDAFGSSLRAADFDGDGHADLAIGTPQEGIGTFARAGAVLVLRGAPEGLTSAGVQSWHQGVAGVPGANETNDGFGRALAVVDLNADANPDLAIGASGEAIGNVGGAGAVTLLFGTRPASVRPAPPRGRRTLPASPEAPS